MVRDDRQVEQRFEMNPITFHTLMYIHNRYKRLAKITHLPIDNFVKKLHRYSAHGFWDVRIGNFSYLLTSSLSIK